MHKNVLNPSQNSFLHSAYQFAINLSEAQKLSACDIFIISNHYNNNNNNDENNNTIIIIMMIRLGIC